MKDDVSRFDVYKIFQKKKKDKKRTFRLEDGWKVVTFNCAKH